MLFLFAAVFGIYAIGRSWLGPVAPGAHISQSPSALPLYALYSLVRIGVAYGLSLIFALGYGYLAANSRRAEIILIPLLDILQSIPVLSFLPGVMLAMVALFPHRQIGVELGSVLLIFTGQVWNIAFSFYSSLKTEPRELKEAARIYRFGNWQRFAQLDLPFSTIGLVWNSMMSVAGGWFFLMACEMFVLGDRDFRLPGLGSFLQTAAGNGDTRAVLYGLAAMVGVIVLLDQLIWRPIIIWADKFKFEQVQDAKAKTSTLLQLVGRAAFVIRAYRFLARPLINWLTLSFADGARKASAIFSEQRRGRWSRWVLGILGIAVLLASGFAVFRGIRELSSLHRQDYFALLRSASFTFLRVNAALLLGALWTVPIGVAIGSSPRFSKIAQPIVQLAASIPATALFPVLLLFLIRLRGGLEIAAMLLMLLGTQWYILFNVIAGAMAVPHGPERGRAYFLFHNLGSLAVPDVTGNFSVSDYRHDHRVGRSVERQYHRRILSLSRPHCFGPGPRQHHQRGQRFRPLRSAAGLHVDHGHNRRAHESSRVASSVSASVVALQA
jgi:NitT/TauT family transport system permease protein